MYFSKFEIDTKTSKGRKMLADRQEIHCAIQKMFNTDRKTSNVLYRLNGSCLYVSSEKRPEEIDDLSMVYCKELNLADGTHRFSLVTIPRKGVDGKKFILKTEEERMSWLHRKAEENGFALLSVRENGYEPIRSFRKKFDVNAFRYDGILMITDVDKFAKARLEGIATMKAYGCGMLVVA